jgi:hypothetical protein
VLATPVTSTTFSIESAHPDFADATLEFGAGDNVRCKTIRLRGPSESQARQRLMRSSASFEPVAPPVPPAEEVAAIQGQSLVAA